MLMNLKGIRLMRFVFIDNKSSIKMSYAPISSMYLTVLVMSLEEEVSSEKANARYSIFYFYWSFFFIIIVNSW